MRSLFLFVVITTLFSFNIYSIDQNSVDNLLFELKKISKRKPHDYETVKTLYGFEVQSQGLGKCSKSQIKKIKKSADIAIEKGFKCLSRFHNKLLLSLYNKLISSSAPKIQCAGKQSHMYKTFACAQAPTPGSLITLGVSAFKKNSLCGKLESIIFHEFLHSVGMRGNVYHNTNILKSIQENDPVYACQLYCFIERRNYKGKRKFFKNTCKKSQI